MDTSDVIGKDWQFVLAMMPSDLEESAGARLALVRRREIVSAGDLLRLALAYGLCDFSLRQTAAWAGVVGIGRLSDVAVLRRLKHAEAWLGYIVLRWLQERGVTRQVPACRVRLVDATALSQPGSRGTDWRVHLGLDLAQQRITAVEVTTAREGESLRRQAVASGEVVVADRGYSQREGVASVLDQGGHVVVRLNGQNFPLASRRGQALDLVACLETLGVGELGDWAVQFEAHEQTYPLRLIALRKTPAAALQEQTRLQREARHKQHQPDPRSLRAAHFIAVVTDLPADRLPAAEALELYRLRWQIEMAFKRLKSLLHLDPLRAKSPRLARAYLYAKLLGALIVDELCHQALASFPWGFPLLPQAR